MPKFEVVRRGAFQLNVERVLNHLLMAELTLERKRNPMYTMSLQFKFTIGLHLSFLAKLLRTCLETTVMGPSVCALAPVGWWRMVSAKWVVNMFSEISIAACRAGLPGV